MLSAPRSPSICDPVPRYAWTARSASRDSAAFALRSADSRCARASSSLRSISESAYFASLYCSATDSNWCWRLASLSLAASTSLAEGAASEVRVREERITGEDEHHGYREPCDLPPCPGHALLGRRHESSVTGAVARGYPCLGRSSNPGVASRRNARGGPISVRLSVICRDGGI